MTSFAQKTDKEIKDEVAKLVGKMTLEEKVGQMTQLTIQAISKKQGNKDQHHELDLQRLEEVIVKYHVGSILNVYDKAHEINYWHEVINKIQDVATKKTRLNIPVMYGIDAIHGATYTLNSTLFPQALGMASTWNREIAKKTGEITALETYASGIPWNFNPVLDLGRQHLWPRLWETYGEDVFLASEMGYNYIKASQENASVPKNRFTTCLKHYVGYSFPLNGLDRTPAWISERMLREYFLPPFEAGVKAGALTVMVNSGEIDGIPGHANYHLLTEVLRGEMNFQGFVVSDWEDIKRLFTRDRVADSPKEAVRLAVMAGVDMSMVPQDLSFYELLVELVKENKVPMSRIDEAVSRILYVKMKIGLFENPYPDKTYLSKFATPENTQANLDAAHESIVLLKNDKNILPLKKDKQIFVTGPTSRMLSVLNGGWTITWQGNEESLMQQDKKTVVDAMVSEVSSKKIIFNEGCSFDKMLDVDNAVNLAKQADVVVLCLGESAYCETPGNITDLTLPKAQIEYAKKIIATGKPVVLVMLEGRPRVITEIADKVDGIVVAFLPGMQGGVAISDVLFGNVNPSGKLPITYPKSVNGITLYDYKPIEFFDGNKYDPLFPFGHGLSYTKFTYSNLKLNATEMTENGEIKVTVDVKNSGDKKGKEVVQLYLTDVFGSVSRPNKQLKGFDKIELSPGETKTVTFVINKDHLSFIGLQNKRIVEKGDFVVTVKDLQAKFSLK
ncbi:glycoside hydrolase family 3 N-terminal domain-containing protein [Ignavibacteriales bacterium]